jgi:hypothetical protein
VLEWEEAQKMHPFQSNKWSQGYICRQAWV